MRCVLLQEQGDKVLKLIGFLSRSPCDAERRCDLTRKEFLAAVWVLLKLKIYCEASRFMLKTDHQVLRWTLDLRKSTGRLSRWSLWLVKFNFEIIL